MAKDAKSTRPMRRFVTIGTPTALTVVKGFPRIFPLLFIGRVSTIDSIESSTLT